LRCLGSGSAMRIQEASSTTQAPGAEKMLKL
jgi:hypothetical protein